MSRIRITGGQWRSRLIHVIDAPGLRPTPDRVRETLFNWLGHNLNGVSCLDLFAGSGVLGLEAASRGAARATFVERDRQAFLRLKSTLAQFTDAGKAPEIQAVCADALHFAPLQPVDLLFLDPPYRRGYLERIAPRLPQLLAPDARIYAEAEAPLETLGAWRTVKRGQAGQVYFHLLEVPEP